MERFAIREAHSVETVEILLERLEVWIVFVLLHSGDDGGWTDETRDVIDMAIRVVALDAIAEPENLFYPEFVAEFFLDGRAVERGIAVGIE